MNENTKKFFVTVIILMMLYIILMVLFHTNSISETETVVKSTRFVECNTRCVTKLQNCSLSCQTSLLIVSVHMIMEFTGKDGKSCYENPTCNKNLFGAMNALTECLNTCHEQYLTCEQECVQTY